MSRNILFLAYILGLCHCSNEITFLLNASFLKETIDRKNIDESFSYCCKPKNDVINCSGDHFLKNNCIACTNYGSDVPHFLLKKHTISYPNDFPLISKYIERVIRETKDDNVEIILENCFYDDFIVLLKNLKDPDNILAQLRTPDFNFILNFFAKFEISYSKHLKLFLKSLGVNIFLHDVSSKKQNSIEFPNDSIDKMNTGLIIVFIEQLLKFYFLKLSKMIYLFKKNVYYLDLKRDFREKIFSEKTRMTISNHNQTLFNKYMQKSLFFESLKILLIAMKLKKLVIDSFSKEYKWKQSDFINMIPFSCAKIEILTYYAEPNLLKYLYPILTRPTIKKFKLSVNIITDETVNFLKMIKVPKQHICIHFDSHKNFSLLEHIFEIIDCIPEAHISLILSYTIFNNSLFLPKKYLKIIGNERLTLQVCNILAINFWIYEYWNSPNIEKFIKTLMISSHRVLDNKQMKILGRFKNIKEFFYFYIYKTTFPKLTNHKFDFLSNFELLKKIRLQNANIDTELLRFIFYSKTLKHVYFDRVDLSKISESCLEFKGENLYLEKIFILYCFGEIPINLLKYLQNFKSIKNIKVSTYDSYQNFLYFEINFYIKKDREFEFFYNKQNHKNHLYIKKLSICHIMLNSNTANIIFNQKWKLSRILEIKLEDITLSIKNIIFITALKSIKHISLKEVRFINCGFKDFLSETILSQLFVIHLNNINLYKSDLARVSQLKEIKFIQLNFCRISDENLAILININFKRLNEFILQTERPAFFLKKQYAEISPSSHLRVL
ncbi:hypothetical protein CWI37_1352p0010 [Hamiltosporidium tvaerminnensis]|uniref:Uncharacterized protein n=1 Tax=Hamiltosporidium tvaerminnensis TaxID=1176355 RepID=A0A4Q9KWY8_9MICR|nr:hypothetical protein CWI37_1352p0010 [Hamiltosporidium tvaerminnensis]